MHRKTALREAIRQILREAASAGKINQLIDQLVEINRSYDEAGVSLQAGVSIKVDSGAAYIYFAVRDGDGVVIDTSKLKGGEWKQVVLDNTTPRATKTPAELAKALPFPPYGSIAFGENWDGEPCLGAWTVNVTKDTLSGWGPLIYELAIEVASQRGRGLTSDRLEVSDEAHSVWRNYDTARGDIERSQLDNVDEPETETLEDDCDMESANYHSGGKWKTSPLSRLYRKDSPDAMNRLEDLDLLFRDDDPAPAVMNRLSIAGQDPDLDLY